MEEDYNYLITHIGDGKFQVIMSSGEVLNAGPSLSGMVRYTFFEDYTIPHRGWSIHNYDLLTEYQNKISKDISNGMIYRGLDGKFRIFEKYELN